jgi:hypothetical protein
MRKNHNLQRGLSVGLNVLIFYACASSGNCFDIILLNNRYQKADLKQGLPLLGAAGFRFSGDRFFHFPLDSMIFFRLFSKHATSVAASLGRSGR